jgi:hypothetical protein
VYRDRYADAFVARVTILGAAALGFLVTFVLLDHEIRAFKDVVLPLLIILPAYLMLTSLNMWWATKTTAELGRPGSTLSDEGVRRSRAADVIKACCGLALGVIVALWYIHGVSR